MLLLPWPGKARFGVSPAIFMAGALCDVAGVNAGSDAIAQAASNKGCVGWFYLPIDAANRGNANIISIANQSSGSRKSLW